MEGENQGLKERERATSAGALPRCQHHKNERRLLPRGVRRKNQDEAPFGGAVLRDQETARDPLRAAQVRKSILDGEACMKLPTAPKLSTAEKNEREKKRKIDLLKT